MKKILKIVFTLSMLIVSMHVNAKKLIADSYEEQKVFSGVKNDPSNPPACRYYGF